jgi:hypothetical protein
MSAKRTRAKHTFLLWGLLFLLIFLLSLDFWRWGSEIRTTAFGFPSFLLHFVGLQLLFALAVLLFIQQVWKKDDEP